MTAGDVSVPFFLIVGAVRSPRRVCDEPPACGWGNPILGRKVLPHTPFQRLSHHESSPGSQTRRGEERIKVRVLAQSRSSCPRSAVAEKGYGGTLAAERDNLLASRRCARGVKVSPGFIIPASLSEHLPISSKVSPPLPTLVIARRPPWRTTPQSGCMARGIKPRLLRSRSQ